MPDALRGALSVVGRVLLCTIFFMSAVGKDIPNFSQTTKVMESVGVPQPTFLLVGAIAFLILGSISVVLGYKARIGATLLLIFLVLASYFFHDFWTLEGAEQERQTIQFMKNLSMMGAMLLIIANGTGAWSLDTRTAPAPTEPAPA